MWVEDQNKFTIRGRTATLAGKPDLVAIKGEVVRVIDCKTGSRKGSDFLQVLIYLLLLPRVHPECRGKLLSGEVRYFRDDRALGTGDLEVTVKTMADLEASKPYIEKAYLEIGG